MTAGIPARNASKVVLDLYLYNCYLPVFSLAFDSAKNVSRHIRKVHGLERSFKGEDLSNMTRPPPTRAERRKQEKQLKNSYVVSFVSDLKK